MTVSDEELRPYFDAIAANVDDDAPRLSLAAFLEQRGDGRAESIRLGCQVAQMEADDPELQRLNQRLERLPKFSYFGATPPWHQGYRWGRGFIDGVNWSVEQFAAHGDALFQCTPARSLEVLGGIRNQGPKLASCIALSKLRKLTLFAGNDVMDLLAIARSPHLTLLPELVLQNLQLSLDVMHQLGDTKNFPGLSTLHLHWCAVDADVWPQVIRFAEKRKLSLLDVDTTSISTPNLRLLHSSLGARVRPLPPLARDLSPAGLAKRTRFGRLDMRTLAPTVAEWHGILERGPYENVTELTLPRLGDAGVVAFARSGGFSSLRKLNVYGSGLGEAGIAALAESSALSVLEEIDLGEGLCERYPKGIADEAVTHLARSATLRSLRRILRCREWTAYGPQAREGEEVEHIRSGDRVIEDVVFHSIWP